MANKLYSVPFQQDISWLKQKYPQASEALCEDFAHSVAHLMCDNEDLSEHEARLSVWMRYETGKV